MPEGMPIIIERDDGWYVEVAGFGRICSAGPATKEKAEVIFKRVRDAYDQWNREHLS